MQESGAADAVIRWFTQKSSTQQTTHDTNKDEPSSEMRPHVDTKCTLCQKFGHSKHNCDHMAICLNLKEGSKLVDKKL